MSYFSFFMWWMASTWCGLLCQGRFSREWDDELNELLDRHGDVAQVEGLTVRLGVNEVWIGNELYAYAYRYLPHQETGLIGYRNLYRPRISTMYRLYLCCEWHRNGRRSND